LNHKQAKKTYEVILGRLPVFAVILFILLCVVKTPVGRYDEGMAAYNALRVSSGEIPYKDFWAIYPPGQFFALAAVYKIAGASLASVRAYDTLVRFLICLLLFVFAGRGFNRRAAVPTSISAAVLMSGAGSFGYSVYPALMFGILALIIAHEFMQSGRPVFALLSGVAAGIIADFRLDMSAYILIAVIISVCSAEINRTLPAKRRLPGRIFNTSAAVLAGFILTALPVYAALGAASGLKPLWNQLFIFPAFGFHSVRTLPLPSLIPDLQGIPNMKDVYLRLSWWLNFYVPFCICAFSFIYELGKFLRRHTNRSAGRLLAGFAGLMMFVQAASRYDILHVMPSALLAVLILIDWTFDTESGGTRHKIRRPSVSSLIKIVFGGVFLAVFLMLPLKSVVSDFIEYKPWGCYSHLDRAGCVFVSPDQTAAVEYITARTKKDEPIFVGVSRHDRIFTNDVSFYFLSGRPCAAAYSELHPGVATTLKVQKEIAADLLAKDVRWVVLWKGPETLEQNASSVSSGITYLDDFIRSNFSVAASFGNYSVWTKRRIP